MTRQSNRNYPFGIALLGCIVFLACLLNPIAAQPPRSIDLSGEWEFKLDPSDVGRAEHWFDAAIPFDRKITVPGAWNTQGVAYDSPARLHEYEAKLLEEQKQLFGMGTLGKESESAKMFGVYPGPAWYRRTVTLPKGWEGKAPWLIFEGIHREAEVWINGKSVGAHHSYLTPFRIDLSALAKPGDSINVTARVDARRNRNLDPLMGCFDTLDFLYITWGGLFRPVRLEATEQSRLRDLFIIPHLDSESADIRIATEGPAAGQLKLKAEITDATGSIVATAESDLSQPETVLTLPIPHPKLWSPKTPNLYTARVRLISNGQVVDERSTRFGMREFKIADGKFLLNGKPIFLRGYGDDCIFPNTICPPVDKEEFRRRLSIAREYGFNYVRHHSWTPPAEYFEAADELGMMLQPEFPFAYRWDLPKSPDAQRAALEEWQATIRLHRNHPSIVTWCMGNELYDSFDLAPEMYRAARALDPTRAIIDSDGCGFKHKDRATLDFMVVQFGEGNSIGFQDSKYQIPADIKKPVIAHEMGYFVTLPDLGQIDLFHDGARPYWLLQARDLAALHGQERDYPEWLRASYRLQAACLKNNLEAARRSRLSGTSVWLFQDYPNCAEGVVDMFFRPKGLSSAEFQKFNSPSVLLFDAPRRNWRAGEKVSCKILVSRFEDEPSTATLTWSLKRGADVLAQRTRAALAINADGLQEIAVLDLEAPSLPLAQELTLSAELSDGNGKIDNSWKGWIFPENHTPVKERRLRFSAFDTGRKLYPSASEHTSGSAFTDTDLLVTSHLGTDIRDYLQAGGRVILVNPEPAFKTEKTNFRLSSWDGGGPSGTILDQQHPALRAMPSEGWCDLQFYSLIQGSKPIFLDSLPSKITPLIRCIDRPTRLANRAYLFEANVGQGKLLVSGLNFASALAAQDPAAIYFFDQLIQYTIGPNFSPKASIPPESLKSQ